MAEQKFSKVDITIGNLLLKPELQPKEIQGLFVKLDGLRQGFEQTEMALAQARQSMNQLSENRAKLTGSLDTLVELISEQLSPELVEKYGQKPFTQKEMKDELSKTEETKR